MKTAKVAVWSCFVSHFLLLSIGCRSLPEPQLAAYKEAFAAARTTAEAVIEEYEFSLEENAAIEAGLAPRVAGSRSLLARDFDPNLVLQANSRDQNVEARIKTLDTLARYNDVLTSLAEGKRTEQVKGSLDALSGSMGTLAETLGNSVPFLGAATGVVSTFLDFAENARSRADFENAVRKAESIIVRIIDEVLIPDTMDFYGVRQTLAERTLRRLKRQGLDSAKSITKIAGSHAEPQTQALTSTKSSISEKLQVALQRIDHDTTEVTIGGSKRKLYDLTGLSAATPEYTELVNSQLEELLESTEKTASEYVSLIDAVNTYRELLGTYVQMLRKTKAALIQLRTSLEQPADMQSFTLDLITTAKSLHAQFDDLRTQLR